MENSVWKKRLNDLDEGWEDFRKKVLSKEMSEEEEFRYKSSFFAGATIAGSIVAHNGEKGLSIIGKGLDEFNKEVEEKIKQIFNKILNNTFVSN